MPKVMATATGANPRARGRRVSTSLAEINVIPLVDVMLVLLIVFMVAAPMLQKGIEVNLPVSQRADRMAEERLYVTVPASYRTDRRVQLGEEFVRTQVLGERLRQAMQGREQKEVFLRGDGSVQLQDLTEVFGLLRAAGVERVGILTATPPPGRR